MKKFGIVLSGILFINTQGCEGKMIKRKNKLTTYQSKRNFSHTREPLNPKINKRKTKNLKFVIQKHAASHLHYDFRLEIDGVLVSWAVPKGIPTKKEKRLAIMTEDHPLDYATFEGTIPQGEYGGGTVMVWDIGTYKNIKMKNGKLVPITTALKNGQVEVQLDGKKLHGNYALIRYKDSDRNNQWLMIKMHDEPGAPRSKTNQRSALTGRTMQQITKESAQ